MATALAVQKQTLSRLEDKELVRLYLVGEERAFNEVVRRYRDRLTNFVYRYIGDYHTAEDIVQKTFLRVHRHAGSFDQKRKFSTWIYIIAANFAKNELRNRERSPLVLMSNLYQPKKDDEVFEFEDPKARSDKSCIKEELTQMIEAALSKMSQDHRKVFILVELDGYTYEEVSRIARINIGTMKSRLHRARAAFRQIMEPTIHLYR